MTARLRVVDTALPGVRVLALGVDGNVVVDVSRIAPPIPNTAAVQAAWDGLCTANPRFFDGPLLSVLHIEQAAGGRGGEPTRIHARPDRFARLAVQPGVATGVRILSVTAICTATDPSGALHVLLGKRGRETRIYGGMWELGPSGGMSVPPPALQTLDVDAIWSHLADEVHEEIGIEADRGIAIAITRDNLAMSDDVVFQCDLGELATASRATRAANWEYEAIQWIPVAEIAQFDAAHASEIIVPTRALFASLGWSDG
jgi:8-oxo-dGTP pyrophosphatase MutT (NUDIX family)